MELGDYVAEPVVIIFLLVAFLISTLYVFWKADVKIASCGVLDRSELTFSDRLVVAQIVAIARDREQIRKALLAYLSGGATGLFDAYEKVSCEIMNCGLPNYAADEGTRDWLVRHGWVSEEEEDRFHKTVQHFRHGRFSDVPSEALSPREARLFVRGILMSFVQYALANQQSA
ncbi:MAG TPA: hypothetical protein VK724_09430 [Bryobacteraceae bacterium]|nr:hypothetical protein [Bryobacteraceae bacterium]